MFSLRGELEACSFELVLLNEFGAQGQLLRRLGVDTSNYAVLAFLAK